MAMFNVNYYTKDDGTKPVEDFLDGLPVKMRAKMTRAIYMAKMNGTELREPYSKHLEDGIFELRAQIGSDISRVLYFFYVGHRIILTHGFIKKTQKTPRSEIDRAKTYRTEFLQKEEEKK